MDFKTMGLSDALISALETEGITAPTDAQAQAMPLLMAGKDVVLQSQTGSGKTLCYLLPIYQSLQSKVEKGAQVMVIVPTKELAMQIHQEVQTLSKNSGIPLLSIPLFGNVNVNTQIERLKTKPQIIIGTCERILALVQKKKVPAHTVKTFIVDEADKLLDKQAINALKNVRKTCMKYTQMVFVSATYLPYHLEQAAFLAPEATVIQANETMEIPASICHQYLVCDRRDKLENLRKLIRAIDPPKSMIFINDLVEINIAVEKLKYHEFDCACIHSETTKEQRQKHLTAFKNGKLKHLVATDLAARGLHIDEVPCIFHVNVAEDPIDYLHRSGRTGRNGADGLSVCILTPAELPNLANYKRKFSIETQEVTTREGKLILVKP
ncbi:MAG: DEAD/DEAH box helicase [Eubacteriales bacterium]